MLQKILSLFRGKQKRPELRPDRNVISSASDTVLEFSVTYSGPKSPTVPKDLLEEEYQKWRFVTESEPSPIDSKDSWFNPNRKINRNIKDD